MLCLVKSNPEVKALLKRYKDILGSESAAYYVVSMNNGWPLELNPDGSTSELYTALLDSGMSEQEAVIAKSVIYTPLYMDEHGDWTQEFDKQNGSEEPSITTLTSDGRLSDTNLILSILNSDGLMSDLAALERSNVVNHTPAVLNAVKESRDNAVARALDLLNNSVPNATTEQKLRTISKAEADFDTRIMIDCVSRVEQYLAEKFGDVEKHGDVWVGVTELGKARANFINSLRGRLNYPGMTVEKQDLQLLISVTLMNAVLNNRDLSTTIPLIAEQYIRIFLESDFVQELFGVMKLVHGADTHPERLVKLATDYVVGKLKMSNRKLMLSNFWFNLQLAFRKMLRMNTKHETRKLERDMLDALSVYMSCAKDLSKTPQKELNTIFYSTRPTKLNITAKEVVNNLKNAIMSKIISYKKATNLTSVELAELFELEDQLNSLKQIDNLDKSKQDVGRVAAIEHFIVKGLREVSQAMQILVDMQQKSIDQIDVKLLDRIRHDVIGFYNSFIREWVQPWAILADMDNNSSFMSSMELIQSAMNRISGQFDQINLAYTSYMAERAADELVVGNKKRFKHNLLLWLQNRINHGHLSFFDRWLKGGFASESPIIRLFDFALRESNNRVRQTADTTGRELRESFAKAVNGLSKIAKYNPFINLAKLLYEVDEDGKYTGNMISSVNRGAFDKKLKQKTNELIKKYNAHVDENDGSITFDNPDDWRSYKDELDDYIESIGGHRRYKAEYYKQRRKFLSKSTIDILDGIDSQIRSIERKCIEEVEVTQKDGTKRVIKTPLTYRLSQSDRDRLAELKKQRESLSSPYNIVYEPSGKIRSITPKEGSEAQIAQELMSWKIWKRLNGLSYKSDNDAYTLVRQLLLDSYTQKIGKETNPVTGQKYTLFDVDQLMAKFDWENSAVQFTQEYYDALRSILGDNFDPVLIDLNNRRNAIMSACYTKRGYYMPNLDMLSDEAWALLKSIDELKLAILGKLSKGQAEALGELLQRQFVAKTGMQETYLGWLEQLYKNAGRAEEFYQKFLYQTRNGKNAFLSVFYYSAPMNPNWVQTQGTGIFSQLDETSSDLIDLKYDATQPEHIQIDKDMYKNEKFDELISDPDVKNFYDTCLKVLDEAWSKLPNSYRDNKYRLPQVRDSLGSIFTRKGGGRSIWKALLQSAAVNETDTEYNEEFLRRPDGSFVETIPMRRIRSLDDTNTISTDIVSILTDFTEMACNFEEKQVMLPLWELIGFLLKGGFAGRSEGDSDQYKRFQSHKSMYMYGRLRQGLNPGVKMGKIQRVISKLSYETMKLSHSKLMVHNWIAVLRNAKDSALTMYSEIASGRDFDLSCFKGAIKRIAKDVPNTLMSPPVGRVLTRSETAAMMQANGITGSIHELFKGTNLSWIRRVIQSHFSMGEYTLVDYLYKGLITQMTYNSIRLIEDPSTGKKVFATKQQAQYYYTKAGFTANDGKKAWRQGIKTVDGGGREVYSRVTLADAFYVAEDGKYTIKPEFEDLVRPIIDESTGRRSNKLETQLEGFIRERSSVINGVLDEADRTSAQTTFIGAMLLLMRGWCVAQQVDYNKDGHDFAIYANDDDDFSETTLKKYYNKIMRATIDSSSGLILQDSPEGQEGLYDFLAGGTRLGSWTLVPVIKAYFQLFKEFNFIKFAIPDTILDQMGVNSSSLTDLQKYIIHRMNAQLVGLIIPVIGQFIAAKLIEDDPDNWVYWMLYAVCVSLIPERAAALWFPGLIFTLVDVIKLPAIAASYVQDMGYMFDAMQDLAAMAYDSMTGGNGNIEAYEVINSGSYKGLKKWQKDLSRASSMIPGVSEFGFDNMYRRGVFRDWDVSGVRATATWYHLIFPTSLLVYKPNVGVRNGKLQKLSEREKKTQRGLFGIIYNELGTDWREYFYNPNTSIKDKLESTFFGYKDNDSGDGIREIKKPKKNIYAQPRGI